MIKIGLDWCLKNRPKKPECIPKITQIKARMKELNDPDRYDLKMNQEAKEEYYSLKKKLSELEICPEESVGMKRLKELSVTQQRKAFEEYAVPRIEDAKQDKGHKGFNDHWKDMTFERWVP